MNRPLLTALIAVLLIFGVGYLLFAFIFEDAPKQTELDAAPARLRVAERGLVDAAGAERSAAMAARVEGLVEHQTAQGTWIAIGEGETLSVLDTVRVGADSHAIFSIGDSIRFTAPAHSEFRLLEVSEVVSRIQLDEGRIAASAEGRPLRIEVENSDAIAETADGEFSVMTREGVVAVATKRGAVELSAQGKTVSVEAGMQSLVQAGSVPARPTTIPSSLFLKVHRPRASENLETVVVRGRATPGALVEMSGTQIPVGPGGAFMRTVPLAAGSRHIEVEVLDAQGRRDSVLVQVLAPKTTTKASIRW